MSIFWIIILSLLTSGFIWAIVTGPVVWSTWEADWHETYIWIVSALVPILTIRFNFIGNEINTENEKVYIQKYLAQKQTIEMSLDNKDLSGLERLELVKQATEINSEFAEKRAKFELWHYVYYDNSLYDNIDLIILKPTN